MLGVLEKRLHHALALFRVKSHGRLRLDCGSQPPGERDRIGELTLEEIWLFGIALSANRVSIFGSIGPELGRYGERI